MQQAYGKFLQSGELAAISSHPAFSSTANALAKGGSHERHNSNDTVYSDSSCMSASMDTVTFVATDHWTTSHTTTDMPTLAETKRSASVSSLVTLAEQELTGADFDECPLGHSSISIGSQDSDTTVVDLSLEKMDLDKSPLASRQERLDRLNNLGKHVAFSACYQGQFSDEVVMSGDMDEYGRDHLQCLLDKEKDPNTKCNPNYLAHQPHIDWKCRTILVLWLVEVHQEFNLRPETLFLTIQILDRYLTRRVIVREQLQLLGLTSLWLAAKHEEVHGRVPTLEQMVWICCEAFKSAQFKSMELDVCAVLGFQFNVPVPETFLKLQVAFIAREKGQEFDKQTLNLARYLMELSLVHKRFMVVPPSILSISSFVLAEALLQNKTWPCKSDLVHDTSMKLYRVALDAPVSAPAIFNKYNDEIYGSVCKIVESFKSQNVIKIESHEIVAVRA